jgi:hypothetical protein
MWYRRPRRDAIDPLPVLVRLLIGDPDQLGHLVLGQPEHDPSLAHAGADMPVGILRTSPAGLRARLDHYFRHCVPIPLVLPPSNRTRGGG